MQLYQNQMYLRKAQIEGLDYITFTKLLQNIVMFFLDTEIENNTFVQRLRISKSHI